MLTLAIDTSTRLLSIALMHGNDVLASVEKMTKNNQSEILMSSIEALMNEHQVKPTDLKAILVAIGPGSYTGIRVGVTAAKSLAYALHLPVVGVSSLEVMAHATDAREGIVVPMIDARRGTVFAGAYQKKGGIVLAEAHYSLDMLFERLVEAKVMLFVGDGANNHEAQILHHYPQATVIGEERYAHIKAVALSKVAKIEKAVNPHTLVPNYLRKTEAEMNLDA
ncbi:MAG: tRNA (adenosine(37)-N6)-threonylcarbamoyltransferase complex dimerization subunit type 1 TsaB [Defluviitaleaceae bacterium]|nr:tRNA (adenosine(37)-N6)-threonylcarbamoyltransferase complex dimerization subunit type 1 TsaB [Defluviitaleaceae bacterium]